MPQEQTKHEARNYHRTQMKRELIIQKLREQGCRITRQRRILLDIILEEECSCCKEIYYKALQKDSSIGPSVHSSAAILLRKTRSNCKDERQSV